MNRHHPAVTLALLLAMSGITAVLTAPTAAASTTRTVTTVTVNAASVKAIDSANIITDPGWFVQAYDAGIRLYVMHSTGWGTCEPWSRTQEQLKMALDAGLKIAVYTRDATCWEGGIAAAGPYQAQLAFFALDVEPGSPPVTREMVDGVRAMGVRPVIYSGSGMWPTIMDGSTAFADVPLWDANAGPVDYAGWTADTGAPGPVGYGGWNTAANPRIGVQQKFEHELNGVLVDLNSFDAAFLGLTSPEAPPAAPLAAAPAPQLTATPLSSPAPRAVRVRWRR